MSIFFSCSTFYILNTGISTGFKIVQYWREVPVFGVDDKFRYFVICPGYWRCEFRRIGYALHVLDQKHDLCNKVLSQTCLILYFQRQIVIFCHRIPV
jgi:hypothetical protein